MLQTYKSYWFVNLIFGFLSLSIGKYLFEKDEDGGEITLRFKSYPKNWEDEEEWA